MSKKMKPATGGGVILYRGDGDKMDLVTEEIVGRIPKAKTTVADLKFHTAILHPEVDRKDIDARFIAWSCIEDVVKIMRNANADHAPQFGNLIRNISSTLEMEFWVLVVDETQECKDDSTYYFHLNRERFFSAVERLDGCYTDDDCDRFCEYIFDMIGQVMDEMRLSVEQAA